MIVHAPADTAIAVMEGGIQRWPPSTITKGSMRHVRSVSPSDSEYTRHLGSTGGGTRADT